MAHLVSCRLESYGDHQERAFAHLPTLGIVHVEIACPKNKKETTPLKKKLAAAGLKAASVQLSGDLSKPDAVEALKPQLDGCATLGATVAFLSIKAGDADRSDVYARLHALGDAAQKVSVTVACETHPDLITNGDVARETMKAVNHPNIRVNFDTANIYFYNQGRTAVDELPKIIDHVVAVHLKDTTGGYKVWNFPTLGTGVVDFPRVIKLLEARKFNGPYTIELEGVEGVKLDEAAQLKYVADSAAYLKKIGLLKG